MPGKKRSESAVVESSGEYVDGSPEIKSQQLDANGGKLRMEEVKQIIATLKDKLMERHIMSKKVSKLEKILQKINDTTNSVMIEMDNRVEDLNRDWQQRLQTQNAKWKDRISALNGYDNKNKLLENTLANSYDVANPIWRMEQRLTQILDRLTSITKMEQNLENLMKLLNKSNYYQQRIGGVPFASKVRSQTNDICTARSISNLNLDNVPNTTELYGVTEMTETYLMCLRNLERSIKSLELIKQMPAIFGVMPGGLSTIRDVNHTVDVLKQFSKKLKISLDKCNFHGSREMHFS